MRIHKAIENIQAAIDRHQDEWLKDNGYEPEEHVRKRTTEPDPPKKPQISRQSGQFAANRFLGETSAQSEHEQEPETQSEPAEIVSVIKQNDKNHSWLYNEVLAAINNAAENNKGTKIIAVFIPIVRSGEEFNDLPVDEKVTLPTVYDENVHVEELPPFKEFLEEPAQPQDTEPLQKEEEPESQPEENMPVSLEKIYAVGIEQEALPEEEPAMTEQEPEPELEPEQEPEPEPEQEPEPEPEQEPEPEPEPEPELEPVEETAEIVQEEEPYAVEPEAEPEQETESVGDILSGTPENPEELQSIFRTMEEKLEDTAQYEEEEPEEFAEDDAADTEAFADELVDAIMEETIDGGQEEQNIDFDDLEPEPEPEGQKLEFTEIEDIESTEEPAAEPEHITLKDIAITAEAPTENPAEETEDDEFDDTEILPDSEEISI